MNLSQIGIKTKAQNRSHNNNGLAGGIVQVTGVLTIPHGFGSRQLKSVFAQISTKVASDLANANYVTVVDNGDGTITLSAWLSGVAATVAVPVSWIALAD